MTLPHILIISGPNLNMLGKREPEIYGYETLDDVHEKCKRTANDLKMLVSCRQSNHEGEIVTWLQEEMDKVDGIIINAAAYTHTSVAIHDALKLHSVPVIEVHISNPKEREEFRHLSYIEPIAEKVFAGYGTDSYLKAIEYLSTTLNKD